MHWEVSDRPSYALLKVKLDAGEEITAEPGAMMLMRGNISIDTGAKSGFLSALLRSAFGGESFFLNTFIAKESAEIWIAPKVPGDICYLPLSNKRVYFARYCLPCTPW
jgi:uncharacterized protein (AIM24 family)